jgi:hypothetical protein
MKSTLKSRLHLAAAAGLMGLAAVSAQVHAQPALSVSNTGQALIYPYYTVNGGWITTFNLINTSPNTLAVKVRFHEMKNSRDVLDFTVVMSPYDTWTAWVQDSDRGTQLRTVDNSCTSPVNVDGVNASNFAYTGIFDDTGGTGLNRLREGYVEILLMGEAPAGAENTVGTVPYNAEHVNGVPRDCAAVDSAFIATAPNWVSGTYPADAQYVGTITNSLAGTGDPEARDDFQAPTGNWLKGNVGWLNAATGYGAGSEAIAIADWAGENLVTAQQFPWFLEPTFATETSPWVIDAAALDTFEATVSSTATMNEWADNPVNGAQTDWVVSFPTKAFHADKFNEQIQAAVSSYRNADGVFTDVVDCTPTGLRTDCVETATGPTLAPFTNLFGVAGADPVALTGDSKVTVQWDVYDREEGTQVVETDGTTISPAPPPEVEIAVLKWEANVVSFAESGSVLASNFPAALDASTLLGGAGSGWARLTFVDGALPVTAFAVRAIERTQDGQAYNAGYEGR